MFLSTDLPHRSKCLQYSHHDTHKKTPLFFVFSHVTMWPSWWSMQDKFVDRICLKIKFSFQQRDSLILDHRHGCHNITSLFEVHYYWLLWIKQNPVHHWIELGRLALLIFIIPKTTDGGWSYKEHQLINNTFKLMTAQTPYIWNKLVFCFSDCLYAALSKKWTSYYIVFTSDLPSWILYSWSQKSTILPSFAEHTHVNLDAR